MLTYLRLPPRRLPSVIITFILTAIEPAFPHPPSQRSPSTMRDVINHSTHAHIVHKIMFATRSVMLAFRGTSRAMRDAVDSVIFHTAVLAPTSHPAFFVLCERNESSLLPWIPMHAYWPDVMWPGFVSTPPPLLAASMSLNKVHSQLSFVRVLTVQPAAYLSRTAFAFPSAKHLFHLLDTLGQLEELSWGPLPTSPSTGYVAAGDTLATLRPDLPLAQAYTFRLSVAPRIFDTVAVPSGVPRVVITLTYNRHLSAWNPREEAMLDLGSLRLEGNVGEVIILLDIVGVVPSGRHASSTALPNLLGLFNALGLVLKCCLATNVVRPRQLSFVLVGLERLVPSEVGLPPSAGKTRTSAAAVTRVLYPRASEMGIAPVVNGSSLPTPFSSPTLTSTSATHIPQPSQSLAFAPISIHALAQQTFPPSPPHATVHSTSVVPPSPPDAPPPNWMSQGLVGHLRVYTHIAWQRLEHQRK